MYAQHLTYFFDIKRKLFPRQALLTDHKIKITSWTKEGDQFIVTGDLKEYIFSHQVHTFFAKIGIREQTPKKYGPKGLATTRSNIRKHAIDGVWGSQGITIYEGG